MGKPSGATLLAVLAVGVVAAAIPVVADEYRGLHERFRVGMGSYTSELKTDAAIGFGGAVGTLLRIEDDLTVDEDDHTVGIQCSYRFNDRQAIGFATFSTDRSGASTIAERIEVDGITYDVGAFVDTEFGSDLLRVDWRYTLISNERARAEVIVGLSMYRFDLALEGDATVDDGMGGMTTVFERVEEDALTPVPTLGLQTTYGITRTLLFRIQASWMDAELSDTEGRIVSTSVGLEWNFHRSLGIGINGSSSNIKIRTTGEDPFLFDLNESGTLIYLTVAF